MQRIHHMHSFPNAILPFSRWMLLVGQLSMHVSQSVHASVMASPLPKRRAPQSSPRESRRAIHLRRGLILRSLDCPARISPAMCSALAVAM
jgi:hypothetical protein